MHVTWHIREFWEFRCFQSVWEIVLLSSRSFHTIFTLCINLPRSASTGECLWIFSLYGSYLLFLLSPFLLLRELGERFRRAMRFPGYLFLEHSRCWCFYPLSSSFVFGLCRNWWAVINADESIEEMISFPPSKIIDWNTQFAKIQLKLYHMAVFPSPSI